MDTSAIILAGGQSSRLGQDKGLLNLANKPLIMHILDAVNKTVNEKLVVTSSEAQAQNYRKIVSSDVKIVVDREKVQTPLAGALTGFEEARGTYSLLLPSDTPLVSKDVLSLLLELCENKAAVIPRWPNGYIEPLQAAYHTKSALVASEQALKEGERNLQCMVNKLRGIRYISTLVLQQLDPQLNTFFNVNTSIDLKKAGTLLKNQTKA